MRHRATTTTRDLLLVLAVLSCAACGGSGGSDGDTGPGPAFEGTYGFLLLEWVQAADHVRSTVGTLTPDGAGGVTLASLRSTQAGTDKTVALTPLTYAADGARRIVFTDRTGRLFTADLSSDGSMLAGTTRETGTQPALLLLVRCTAAFTLADLAGDWMEVAWGRDRIPVMGGDEIGDYALALDESVDGAGNAFIDGGHEIRLDEYSFIPAIGSSTTTLETRAGGLVAWLRPFDGLTTHLGNVSMGHDLMLLGGEYASEATSATLCVRRGQPVSGSQLAGTYRSSGIGSSILGHHVRWGVTTFAAGGSGSSSFDHDVEGIVLGPGSEPFDWVLETESRVTVQWGDDALPLHGIVGAGGAYVVLAGGFENGATAELHVLLR